MTARTRKTGPTSKAASTDDGPEAGPAGATETTAEALLGPEDHDVPATGERLDAPERAATAESDERPGPVEDSESGHPYLNVSGGPLVYTEDGHTVDADAWTPEVNLDPVGRRARDRGYLKSRTALGIT